MKYFVVVLSFVIASAFCAQDAEDVLHRGVQVRVTDKGLAYAVQVGFDVMERELEGKPFPRLNGTASIVYFDIQNAVILDVSVGASNLDALAGRGIGVSVANMNLNIKAKLHYKLRSFIPISDTKTLKAIVTGISLKAVFDIGADTEGKPNISTVSCSASIGGLSLKFEGGMSSFVYNTLSSLLSGVLKNRIATTICDEAKAQVANKTAEEMKTFPSAIPIDEFASIDYRLTSPPLFTKSYMDVFIKGKFISRTAPSPTHLRIPSFPTTSDSDKMVYMWLTDYTLNTACEVYHKSGALNLIIQRNDTDLPYLVRFFMSTSWLLPFMPKLYFKYPGMPLRFFLSSRKAPVVEVVAGQVMVKVSAHAAVQVDTGNNETVGVFYMNMDMNATASVAVKDDRLTGAVNKTSFHITLGVTDGGSVTLPMQNPIMKWIFRYGVLKQVNAALAKGFPLPKVDDFSFDNSTIILQQDVIRVGTDFVYSPKDAKY